MGKRVGKRGLECSEELAPRSGRRVCGARAADKDDAGGEGAALRLEIARILRSHRPSTADVEASLNNCVKEGFPTRAGRACHTFSLRLLKSIINGDREAWMDLLGEAVHCPIHAVHEEGSCRILVLMAVGKKGPLLLLLDGRG